MYNQAINRVLLWPIYIIDRHIYSHKYQLSVSSTGLSFSFPFHIKRYSIHPVTPQEQLYRCTKYFSWEITFFNVTWLLLGQFRFRGAVRKRGISAMEES